MKSLYSPCERRESLVPCNFLAERSHQPHDAGSIFAVRRDGSLTRSAGCVAPESMFWVVALPSMAGLVSQFNCARSGAVAVWLVLLIQLPERKVP